MTVSIVSICAHGADEVAVTFSLSDGIHKQTERLLLSAARCADLNLCVGASDEQCFDGAMYASRLYDATKRALAMLGFGRYSAHMMEHKLVRRGINAEIAADAVADLIERGYLSPAADALAEAQKGLAKQWGKLRIHASLRQKGYGDEDIRAAIEALEDEGADFEGNCAAVIRRRWCDVPIDATEKKKMVAALMRLGYTSSEIRAACRLLNTEN